MLRDVMTKENLGEEKNCMQFHKEKTELDYSLTKWRRLRKKFVSLNDIPLKLFIL